MASRARRLYQATKSENELAGLGKMEAYWKYGILKKPTDADDLLPEPAPKKHKEKKEKAPAPPKAPVPPQEVAPPPPHDLGWFLGQMLAGLDLYSDEAAWVKDDKKSPADYLGLIEKIEKRLAELRTLLVGKAK